MTLSLTAPTDSLLARDAVLALPLMLTPSVLSQGLGTPSLKYIGVMSLPALTLNLFAVSAVWALTALSAVEALAVLPTEIV